MPQITSIEPQKKKKNRFNVFLDGQFAFGVDEAVLVKNRLKVGQLLTKDQVKQLFKETILAKLTDYALKFLSYRSRSEREISQYLAKKIARQENVPFTQGKTSLLVSQVMARLKKYQYINDREFAKWWIQSRVRSGAKGKLAIRQELLQKGIEREVIDDLLAKNFDEGELAKKIVTKQLKHWQQLSAVDFKKRVYSYLLRKGFDLETIKETFAFLAKKR